MSRAIFFVLPLPLIFKLEKGFVLLSLRLSFLRQKIKTKIDNLDLEKNLVKSRCAINIVYLKTAKKKTEKRCHQ